MSKTYIGSIIDTMQNAVWVLELDPCALADPSSARVIHVNPAAAALLRCSRRSLIGRPLLDLVPSIAVNKGAWWASVTSGHDVFGKELDLIGPKRVEVPVMLVASILPSRTEMGRQVICVAQDLIQRRLTQHLLRENDRLLDEIMSLQNALRGLQTPRGHPRHSRI